MSVYMRLPMGIQLLAAGTSVAGKGTYTHGFASTPRPGRPKLKLVGSAPTPLSGAFEP